MDFFIINDETRESELQPPSGYSTGLILPPASEKTYAGVAEPFPDSLLIPRSEWQARIQERKERKTRLADLIDQAGLSVLDQNGTNYCWINAPVHSIEIKHVVQNQKMVRLSPASAGGPIKGFRNVGGWGKEGLEWLVKYGCCPVENWPANAISRAYYTEENKAIALKYRADEWWVLEDRNIDQHVSALLLGFPVAVGLNYWGHEVTDIDLEWLDGEPCPLFNNSWGPGWGNKGRGVRQGNRRFADDAVCLRTAYAVAA